ncbi:TPM domain-containing protein [Ornithinimicrobium pratense]|uniref:TPM domain-containing protein n=1 Tax=Ornithinimicrobium pratense TaxID=2593973 RepID=UPI0017889C5F|nr:TPM domain-containing protein [Ornithinimicrobium pratense]
MLLVPPAAAEPPQRLEEQLTDPSAYLSPAQVREVTTALAELADGHAIVLHVVLVEDFDGMDGIAWAEESFDRTGLGADDALLAVAVEAGRYGLIDETEVHPDRARQIAADEVEPQLREGDWAGAAVAAAQGYAVAEPVGARAPWAALLGTLGAMAAVVAGVVGTRSWRRRRQVMRTLLAERERTSGRLGQLRERLEGLGQEVRFVPTELSEEDAQWAGERHQQAETLLDEAVTTLGRVPRELRGWPPSQDTALDWQRDHDQASRALDRLDDHLTASAAQLQQAREIVTGPAPLSDLTVGLEEQRGRREQVAEVAPRTEPAAPTFVRRRVAELTERADTALDGAAAALRTAHEHVAARRGQAALEAVTSAREHLGQATAALDRATDPQAELDQAVTDLHRGQRALHSLVTEGERELGQHQRYASELAPPGRGGRWSKLSPDVLDAAVRQAREVVDAAPGDDPQAQLGQVEVAASGLGMALGPYQQARTTLQQRQRARERAWEEEDEDARYGSGSGWSASRSSRSRSSRSRSSRSRSSRSSSSRSRSSSRNRSGGRF